MADVTRDVYAVSTIGPMSANLRTILSFLDCWGLTLTPYTPEVVFALGLPSNGESTGARSRTFTSAAPRRSGMVRIFQRQQKEQLPMSSGASREVLAPASIAKGSSWRICRRYLRKAELGLRGALGGQRLPLL